MYENIKNFTRNNKSNIIISSVFILSVYLIKLGTLATSIDNEAAISVSSSLYNAWLSMGRIALVYLKKVFGVGIYNPFLSMFMLIVLMIFSIITWGMIFDYIKNNKNKYAYWIFISIFFTAPIMAEQLGFVMQAVEVLLGINLVAISLFYTYRYFIDTPKKYYLIISVILSGIAFSIYQALTTIYVTAAICLFILYISRKDVTNPKKIWQVIILNIILFFLSYVVYFVLAKCVLSLLHIEATKYTGDQVAWGTVPVIQCIKNILKYIKGTVTDNTIFYSKVYVVLAILLVINAFYGKKEKYDKRYYIYILAIGALLVTPFLMGIILGGQPTKRTAISYPFMLGFSSMYLFEEIRTKIKNKDAILILMVLVALVPFKQSVLSSRLYYTEYITNKESEIVATKISNRIEEITGSYNPKEKIAFIGCMRLNRNNSCYQLEDLEYVGRGFFETSFSTTHGSFLMRNYMATLGINYQCPSEDDAKIAEEYAKDMPAWPNKESVKKVDNIVIVKLG